MGDPGLLVSRSIRRRPVRTRVAFLAHHDHRDHGAFDDFLHRYGGVVDVIDVRLPLVTVARRIAQAGTVVSSSLHGLIVADSLGVPAERALTGEGLLGGNVKFDDYEAVVKPEPRWLEVDGQTSLEALERVATTVDAARVRTIQDDLLRALHGALARQG
ncbi:polysaccharide pyruvyl transferase family protein [Aestuariimicrobium soli]|uniref:polysaccharide pyruvyl transferase family protein n=1 Tax=Aestuariimicrobium soli TaxID=2035834 RepID=UPI003EB7F9ED